MRVSNTLVNIGHIQVPLGISELLLSGRKL